MYEIGGIALALLEIYIASRDSRTKEVPIGTNPRLYCAGEICKRKFISLVRPIVVTETELFFNPEEFENVGFSFLCGWKTF